MKNQETQENLLPQLEGQFLGKLKLEGKSQNTLKNYKTDLECFNQFVMKEKGRLDIDDFGLPHILKYGEYLQHKYSSDNSRRRRVQALRRFFDFLVEKEIVSQNPVRKIPTSPKFLDIPRPTPFIDIRTLWEYQIQESQSDDPMTRVKSLRNQLITLLIFTAGLKVSDLTKLKVHDFQLDKEKPRVIIKHPKKDSYSIPLPPLFTSLANLYLQELSAHKQRSKLNFEEVFFNANAHRILSGGLSARGFELIFEEYRKKLMISLTPKSLRQSCIFNWLQKKVPDTTIREWMGVAPSYDLKLYKDHMNQNLYREEFLTDIYYHHQHKKRPNQ